MEEHTGGNSAPRVSLITSFFKLMELIVESYSK